jgi:hypothetical protein
VREKEISKIERVREKSSTKEKQNKKTKKQRRKKFGKPIN